MIVVDRTIHPSVATLRLNRPEKRNALNAALVTALTEAVLQAGEDPSVKVVVLTGTGKAFSAGADLAALQALATGTFEDNLRDSQILADLFESIYHLGKPIIARVNGHAIAGGCGLAAVCDFVVAQDDAKLGFTEVRIGFVPAIISVYLRERLPDSVLRGPLLTGRLFSAAEAASMKLVTRVVAPEDLDSEVAALARTLAREASGGAIAATKGLLRAPHADTHSKALADAVLLNAKARGTEACRAGVRAFLEKTPYPWAAAWDEAG
jgi:methylglutaconyl-CoA hydratase